MYLACHQGDSVPYVANCKVAVCCTSPRWWYVACYHDEGTPARMGWENSPLALHGAYFWRGSFFPSLSEGLLAKSRDYQGIEIVSVELESLGIFQLKSIYIPLYLGWSKFVKAMCELRIELVHYFQLCYSTQFNVIPNINRISRNSVTCNRTRTYSLAHIKWVCNKFVAMKVIVKY